MNRPHYTIAQLMVFVLLVGVSFAALRNANAVWASATFTIAIITISVALVAAFARRGKARMAWAGYAATGWACLVIWLATSSTAGSLTSPPRLLLSWGLLHLQPSIQPAASGGQLFIAYLQISHSLEVIFLGLAGAVLGRILASREDRPNP